MKISCRIFFLGILLAMFALTSCQSNKRAFSDHIITRRRSTGGYALNVRSPFGHRRGLLRKRHNEREVFASNSVVFPSKMKRIAPHLEMEMPGHKQLAAYRSESSLTASRTAHPHKIQMFLNHVADYSPVRMLMTKIDFKSTKRAVAPSSDSVAQNSVSSFALMSFFFALAGLFIAGILFGIAAVVFGVLAFSDCNKNGKNGRGFAIVGLIIGILDVIAVIAFLS